MLLLMKKLLGIVVLVLLWCNSAYAEIIFERCRSLEPNHSSSEKFIINLERGVIQNITPNGEAFYFSISNNYGEIFSSGELIDSTVGSLEEVKVFHKLMPTKYTFDIPRKRISMVVRLNPDAQYPGQRVDRDKVFRSRIDALAKILHQVRTNPPPELISVVYMYYDDCNDQIVKQFPTYFVDDKKKLTY